MVTLRMLAIASALLVSLPVGFALADHAIGHTTVPGGEVVRGTLEAYAEVTDIVLADLPQAYDRAVVHNAPEQLVEGHTVFVTWDIKLVPNVTNWTADIAGDVSCAANTSTSGPQVLGLPFPNRVDRARLECQAGGVIFVTPDPFYDSSNTYQQSSMQPTGSLVPYTTPDGQRGHATEYVYDLIAVDWLGEATVQTLYAWSVPLMEPWMHADGRTKSWYCPLPGERLQEMGIATFRVDLESDLRSALAARTR